MPRPLAEAPETPYALVTFGGGPRICIGINFAMIEVKALVAHVLRTYDLEAVPGPAPQQLGFLNTAIVNGVRLRVRPRGGAARAA